MYTSFRWRVAAFVAVLLCCVALCTAQRHELSSEHVILHEINDQFVSFTSAIALHGSPSLHHTRFPRALSTLFDSFPIQELKLTLTRGRWRHNWGPGIGPIPPPGASLEVTWHKVVKQEQIHGFWRGTTNAVSGLFCTSINALAPSTAYITQTPLKPWTPAHSPRNVTEALQQLMTPVTEHSTVYGVLSQEALCTENIAAIAKLLPCGSSAGVLQMLQPDVLLSAPFHSVSLDLKSHPSGNITALIHVTAALRTSGAQTLADIVQQPPQLRHCPAASATTITTTSPRLKLASDGAAEGLPPWACRPTAHGGLQVCSLSGQLRLSSAHAPLHVLVAPGSAIAAERGGAVPLHAAQQLLGAGEVSATFLLELQRSHTGGGTAGPDGVRRPSLIVCSRTTMPWFLRPWIHTLTASVDGSRIDFEKLVFWARIEPGIDRERMHVIEACFVMQPTWSVVTLSVDVTKTLLYLEEYPPDAHRGFDISPTRVSVAHADPTSHTAAQSRCWAEVKRVYSEHSGNDIVAEWLATLACRAVHDAHTANIVTTLATPDFSMPYVVCSLTSSLLAIFSGLFFTLLTERRRVVALRQLRRANSKLTRLKPLIILALFVVLVPYMDTEWRDWLVVQLQGVGVSQGALQAVGLVAAV
eukprot:jgi/Ulvmu1/6252/UM028_0110.1